jgi:hypothetical protein
VAKTNRHPRCAVSATELAEMGYCEQRVLLAHLQGDQTTAPQRQARKRGLLAHDRYLAQGKSAAVDDRCFVSSCLFGPQARETQALRAFRDTVLLPHAWGRRWVAYYYAVAPSVCVVLRRSPACARLMRGVLRGVVVLFRLAPAYEKRS